MSRASLLSLSLAAAAVASVGHEAPARAEDAPATQELRVTYDAALSRARHAARRLKPAIHAPLATPAPAPAPATFAAPHPATAQLRSAYQGPTLTNPRIVPVVFPGDPQIALIADFTARMTTSTQWSLLAEYGIGPGTALGPLTTAPSPATWTGAALATWAGGQIDAGAFPAWDGSTIFALFLPPGVTVTTQLYPGAPTRTSCVDFDSYHDEAPLASGDVAPIVVVPRCASFNGLSGNDLLTSAAGRQIANAATDPSPVSYPGFDDVGFDGSELGVTFGPEVASLCLSSATPIVHPADLGYAMPRFWSNAAAGASHDPCAPVASGPYFNVAPIVGGTVETASYYTRGLSVAPGHTERVPLALFSDAPTKRWSLSVTTTPATDAVTASLDECEGKNGDVVHLTVKRKKGALQPVQVRIVSTLGKATNQAILIVGR